MKTKRILLYTLTPLFVISALWNGIYSIISYVATNISIRDSFYFNNDLKNKGTHSGGEKYRLTTRQYKLDLVKFNYNNVLGAFKGFNHIDPLKSNYNKEYKLISHLYNIGQLSNSYKKKTALYIPKIYKVYWELSCDSHMPPFVAPAIANMAMIDGMPLNKVNSCYTHFTDHGYNTYYMRGIKARGMSMSKNKICELANKNGFENIIEINESKVGEIISIFHECTKR